MTLWKLAKSVYDAKSLSDEIDNIYGHIKSIYSDISDSHIASAKQAIMAAQNGNYYANEILDAISHLRDAYNISESALHRTRETRLLLIFKNHEDIIPSYQKDDYYLCLSHIAGLISVLYRTLVQTKNADDWMSTSLSDYQRAIMHYSIDVSELKRIDTKYVEEYEETEEETHYGVDGASTIEHLVTRERASESGIKYIEKVKNEMVKTFKSNLISKRLSIS